MPSRALASAEDKNKVRRALPNAKIFAATVARLYVAYPNPQKWAYANIWGALVFMKDKKDHSLYFRMIDLLHHPTVLWEQELYDGFELKMETPFFFTFPGDEYMIGLSFTDTTDSSIFYEKVSTREKLQKKPKKKKETNKKNKGKVDKTQIGLPSEFRHLGHIGYTPEKGFSIENNDPEWDGIFEKLQSLGISAEEIHENKGFIQNFVKEWNESPQQPPPRQQEIRPIGKSRPPPPPPPRRTAPPPPPIGGRRPPPPPPPPSSRRGPLPPPPARRTRTSAAPPPPPPPVRPTSYAAPPPPPPARPSSISASRPTPPPPPPPVRSVPRAPSTPSPVSTPPAPVQQLKSNNPYRMSLATSGQPELPERSPPSPLSTAYQEDILRSSQINAQPSPYTQDHMGDSRSSIDEEFADPEYSPPFSPTRSSPVITPQRPVPPPPTTLPPAPSANAPPPPPPPPPPPAPPAPPAPSAPPAPPAPPPPPAPPAAASPVIAAPSPRTPSGDGDGRGALMDAIRNAGGIGSLRSTPKELQKDRSTPRSSSSPSMSYAAAGAAASGAAATGGNDLASSLIAALQDRKKALQSDDSDSSDDDSEWDDDI